ncbi:hypothetical protein SAMN05421755_10745 [Nitrosomonas sp. Nm33]|nr:hypothetical protein SAMN05421755_10745 [Nitrosomonas sp. Nm33]
MTASMIRLMVSGKKGRGFLKGSAGWPARDHGCVLSCFDGYLFPESVSDNYFYRDEWQSNNDSRRDELMDIEVRIIILLAQ